MKGKNWTLKNGRKLCFVSGMHEIHSRFGLIKIIGMFCRNVDAEGYQTVDQEKWADLQKDYWRKFKQDVDKNRVRFEIV